MEQSPTDSRRLRPSRNGWILALAAAQVIIVLAVSVNTRHPELRPGLWAGLAGTAAMLAGGALTFSFRRRSAPPGERFDWPQGVAWAIAFGLAFLVFTYWPRLSALAEAVPAPRTGINAVVIPQESDVTSDHGSRIDVSESQRRILASVALFGLIGGCLSRMARGGWRLNGHLAGIVWSGTVWTLAGVLAMSIGGVGFYVFGGVALAIFGQARVAGLVVGAFLPAVIAGTIAYLVALGLQGSLARDRSAA
jgi:hypothetical protein